MKQSFALALTVLTLVCALTACGRQNTAPQPGATTGTESAGSSQSGTDTGNTGGTQSSGTNSGTADRSGDSMADDAGSALRDAADDVGNAVDDALTGDTTTRRSAGGVPYDQMMNNDR